MTLHAIDRLAEGLSPQVRGNRQNACSLVAAIGPIPAGAGEPAGGDDRAPFEWAYPRRCGGTSLFSRRWT